MSTKIYNGLKFKKNIKSLEEALDWCITHKHLFVEKAQELTLKQIANNYIDLYDLLSCEYKGSDIVLDFEKQKYPTSLLSFSIDYTKSKILKGEQSVSRIDAINTDISLNLSIGKVNNKILVLYYTNHAELEKLLHKQKELEDYHFQDSTDRPSKISASQWKQRKKDWESVTFPVIDSMFSFTLSNFSNIDYFRFKFEDIETYFPEYEQRLQNMAKRLADNENPHKDSLKLNELSTFFQLTDQWKQTESYRNILKEKTEFCSKKLDKIVLNK